MELQFNDYARLGLYLRYHAEREKWYKHIAQER